MCKITQVESEKRLLQKRDILVYFPRSSFCISVFARKKYEDDDDDDSYD